MAHEVGARNGLNYPALCWLIVHALLALPAQTLRSPFQRSFILAGLIRRYIIHSTAAGLGVFILRRKAPGFSIVVIF